MKRLISAGKGGAGKTTVTAAILHRMISRDSNKKLNLFVLDADPASTLAQKLGWDDKVPSKGIGELKTELAETDMTEGNNTTKTKFVLEKVMKDAITKVDYNGNKISFSYMGHHEENECLCGFNTAVNSVLMQLYNNKAFDYIFVDRDAGLEHINRSVYNQDDDVLMVVTWPAKEYIAVAKEILQLADKLGTTKNRIIVMNSMFRKDLDLEKSKQLLEAQGIDTSKVDVLYFPFVEENMTKPIQECIEDDVVLQGQIDEIIERLG